MLINTTNAVFDTYSHYPPRLFCAKQTLEFVRKSLFFKLFCQSPGDFVFLYSFLSQKLNDNALHNKQVLLAQTSWVQTPKRINNAFRLLFLLLISQSNICTGGRGLSLNIAHVGPKDSFIFTLVWSTSLEYDCKQLSIRLDN